MALLSSSARSAFMRPTCVRPTCHSVRMSSSLPDLDAFLPSQTSVLLSVFAFVGIKAYETRAQGWLEKGVKLRVDVSRVPNGGRGVFADADIPMATVLGAYPGRVLPPLAYYNKLKKAPAASEYCFVLDNGEGGALDPTNDAGKLCEPLPLLPLLPFEVPLLSIDTTLALINEPPPSCDVNVLTEQQGSALIFSTARDVYAGEELYLDYGPTYDRSNYGR